MKKLLIMALLVMLFSMSVASASVPGDTVTVAINFQNNDCYSAVLNVSYNSDVLQFVSMDCYNGFTGSFPRIMGVSGSDPLLKSGKIAQITFVIKAGAPNGTYYVSASGALATVDETKGSAKITGGSVVVDAPAHEHSWSEKGTPNPDATCTEDGVMEFACSGCSEKKTEKIPAKGHEYTGWVVDTEATCTEDGQEKNVCSRCKDTQTQPIPAGHKRETVPAKAPTCTETGLTEGEKCSECGHVFTEQTTIDALGHDLDDGVVTTEPDCTNTGVRTFSCQREGCNHTETDDEPAKGHTLVKGQEITAATCTEAGESGDVCSVCGYVVNRQTIDPLGHLNDIALQEEKPTCTETGLTAGVKCSRCKVITTPQTIVEALDHLWGEGVVTTQPTCTKTGVRTYTCGRDASHTRTEEEPVISHTLVEDQVITAATCTEPGESGDVCSVCNYVDNSWIVSPLGHRDEITLDAVAPTCTETGLTEGKRCPHCEEVTVPQTTVEALDHLWDEGVVTKQPTCTEPGVRTYTCGHDASHTRTEEEPVISHTIVKGQVITAATCTKPGKSGDVCSVCKYVENSWITKALDHLNDIPLPEEKPTCTETGKTAGVKCSRCEEITTPQEEVDALGHDLDEGVVTMKPTCEKTGIRTFSCQREGCGYTEPGVEPAAGHTFDEEADVVYPTCTEDGKVSATCTVCKVELVDQILDALGHDMDEVGFVSTKPTCTENGVRTFECQREGCDHYTNAVEPAIGHDYDDGVETTPATCEEDGVTTFTCQNEGCGNTYTKPIEKLGHAYDGGVETTPATCEEEGVKTFTCQNEGCGDTYTKPIKKLGHKYDKGVVTTLPTCEEEGVKTFTCQNDATHQYTEPVKKLGHKYDKGVVTTEPTCKEEGVKTFTCQNDASHQYTEPVKKLPHKYDKGVVTTQPTCTEAGVRTYTCGGCGDTYTKPVKALGHDWGKWIETRPATEDADGEKEHTCKVCQTVETKVISRYTWYVMYACSEGIRFRDMENPITDRWYMFTPIDLSVEGAQTFDLIAGNIHKVGTVTVLVQDGHVSVSYELVDPVHMHVTDEFLTFLPTLNGMTELDVETMTGYAYGESINIAETFGEDTKILLLMRNRMRYMDGKVNVSFFRDNAEYQQFVEELKQLMD